MEGLNERLRARQERYLSDTRDLQQMIEWALDKSRDEHEYWEPISVIQHRLPGVLPRIDELARSSDPRQRELAATILGQNGMSVKTAVEACLERLLAMLGSETDSDVISASLYALGHLKQPRGIDASLPYAGSENADVRCAAVSALNGFDDPRALGALIKRSSDTSIDVRNWATFGLGSLTEADTIEIRNALAARLDDEDDEVRDEAIAGLCRRGDSRAVTPFLRVLLTYDRMNLTGRLLYQDIAQSVLERDGLGIEYLPLLERIRDLRFGDLAVVDAAMTKCRDSFSNPRRS